MAYLVAILLIFIPLYPKFPLVGVSGTFVSVRLEDFLIAAILGIWFVSNIKNKFASLCHPVSQAVLLYLAIGFLSIFSGVFVTKTAPLSQALLHAFRRVEYMSMFFVGLWAIRTKDQLHFVIRTFLAVAALVAIYGLGQQFLGWPVISTTNSEFAKGLAVSLGPGARINSTFAGHYDLAAYSIFPLLLIISLLSLKDIRPKWPLILTGTLVYWTMLLSASRVTFAAFYLTTALFLVLIRKWLWLIPLAIIGVVSILASPQLLGRYREFIQNHVNISYASSVSAAAVDDEIPDALKPTSASEDRSLNIRLQAEWPRALRAFYHNPTLGMGFSSVGLAVDNDYLRILAETGLLGLGTFLLVLFKLFKSVRHFLSPPQTVEQAFVVAIFLGLVGLLLNALFIDVFEASKIAIMAWLLLGISQNVHQT